VLDAQPVEQREEFVGCRCHDAARMCGNHAA
jgi:hypothetical protein